MLKELISLVSRTVLRNPGPSLPPVPSCSRSPSRPLALIAVAHRPRDPILEVRAVVGRAREHQEGMAASVAGIALLAASALAFGRTAWAGPPAGPSGLRSRR
jgi:hypothetical protein